MRSTVTPKTRAFLALVRTGQLFALQKAIEAGEAAGISEADWRALVLQAVETGFHSMVEMLLNSKTWSPESLAWSLSQAVSSRRLDLSELLLSRGASVSEVSVGDLCRTMNLDLVRSFFRRGVDPCLHNAFARALNETKAKPLLGIYRSLREEFPMLDGQAALALSEAVNDRDARWVSLLRWAGADPFRPIPWSIESDWDEEEPKTTPASQACWRHEGEMFSMLKLKPTREQALELLEDAAYRPNLEAVRHLLKFIPKGECNDSERGSCRPLEALVNRQHRDLPFERTPKAERERKALECLEILLDHGAKWNPPDDELRYTRRGLGSHDGKYVVRVIRLLLYTEGASQPEQVWELCRTGKIKDLIKGADSALWEELLALRHLSPTVQ